MWVRNGRRHWDQWTMPCSFSLSVLIMVGKGWLLRNTLRPSPILPCERLGKRNDDFWTLFTEATCICYLDASFPAQLRGERLRRPPNPSLPHCKHRDHAWGPPWILSPLYRDRFHCRPEGGAVRSLAGFTGAFCWLNLGCFEKLRLVLISICHK